MSVLIETIHQLWLPFGIIVLILCIVGLVACIAWGRYKTRELEARSEKRALRIAKEIDIQRKTALLEEKRKWHRDRAALEEELHAKQAELDESAQMIAAREKDLEQRAAAIRSREEQLADQEADLKEQEASLLRREERAKQAAMEYKTRLEQLAQLTSDEAKARLFDQLMIEVKQESAHKIKEILDHTRETASREAKQIIALAISRCAVDQSTQSCVAVVPLPNDQIKARIIGKDGRNIRTFEAASGVKVMVDDTPEAVVISCFDPIRREIARMSMERLVSNGKITQSRIEETIAQARVKIEERIMQEGTQTIKELNLEPMHVEIIKLVGRLRFRTSYGQNALEHSKEVAYLVGMMAAELGADQRLARRAGLLHDIGKAVDHEVEGSHPEIGLAYARRYGEPVEVQNAIAAHHNDEEITSLYTFLVSAADAISGARPGARRNDPEDYIKRVVELEELARSFPGVADAYAINAGREIRVMARPEEVNDEQSRVLAFDIAQKIRTELTYPGQIKVVVIRDKVSIGWTNQGAGKRGSERRWYGRQRSRSKQPGSHAAAG